ncbi:hypothetical protein [Paenibacillus sp. NPDC057967]|uniref:hypothetical protein n=1 Tax=Paenibacillus sp. NPDC057967 TaxID=3346293 RepID=UPI0036D76BFF
MKFLAGLLLLALIGCAAVGSEQEEKPVAFDFVFSYGVMNKNVLDTVQGTYTKDLVKNGTSSTKLHLSDNEKKEVYALMQEIGLFDYPNELEGMNIKPSSGYTFQIFVDGKEQNIRWEGEFNETKSHREFQRLTDTIIEMIRNKEAYQALPESDGYYL